MSLGWSHSPDRRMTHWVCTHRSCRSPAGTLRDSVRCCARQCGRRVAARVLRRHRHRCRVVDDQPSCTRFVWAPCGCSDICGFPVPAHEVLFRHVGAGDRCRRCLLWLSVGFPGAAGPLDVHLSVATCRIRRGSPREGGRWIGDSPLRFRRRLPPHLLLRCAMERACRYVPPDARRCAATSEFRVWRFRRNAACRLAADMLTHTDRRRFERSRVSRPASTCDDLLWRLVTERTGD